MEASPVQAFAAGAELSAEATPGEVQRMRTAARLQGPRRIVLLLLAYGALLALMAALRANLTGPAGAPIDWAMSAIYRQRSIADVVSATGGNTLVLLGAAYLVAAVLAVVSAGIARLASRLGNRFGATYGVLAGASRLLVSLASATPLPVIGMALILVFAIDLGWFPIMADFSGNMPELARAMVLPALTLGLLPALALAQSSGRHGGNWLASGLDLAGNLLSQTGGILSAGIVVEYLFGVPGIGRYVMTASTARALPDLLGALGFYALVILVARLLAEACWWFAGLLNPMSPRGPDSGLSGKVYAAVALALLAVPLWLALTGTADNYRAGLQANPAQAGNKPSAEHPWGTDAGGRDVQALLLVSAGNSLRSAAGIGLAAALLSAAGVLLAGAMARKRDWRFETLSDLLLLPADVMLFCPALPALLLLWIILPANQDVNTATTMLTALVVAPRVLRAGRDVWQALPPDVSRLAGGARVLIATLPAAIFAALWLFTGIAFISSLSDAGATLTLGGILNMLLRELDLSPLVFAGLVMLVAPIVLAGADALAGRPQGDPMLRSLNM